MTKGRTDPAEVARAYRLLVGDGNVTELRALEAQRQDDYRPCTLSGYFDNAKTLAAAVSTIATAKGVYIIPNAVNPTLQARAYNRIKPAGKGDTTQDSDIMRRRWLLIDADPPRPAGISSSDDEHAAALQRVQGIVAHLTAAGWPGFIVADSGNGAHALGRIDLTADDGGLVQRCLQALSARFDDAAVRVDTSVYNPARIWKLYGTVACKGDDVPGRPWRIARIIDAPDNLEVAPVELLQALAAEIPTPTPKPAGQGTNHSSSGERFNVAEFIARHGLITHGPHDWDGQQGGGQRWTFRRSPMCDHHGDGPFIVQHASGAVTAGCHHDSCTWTWAALRQKYEPCNTRHQGAIDGLVLECAPTGRYGKTTVTARWNAELIDIDDVFLTKESERTRYVNRLSKAHAGIDKAAAAAELFRLAAKMADKPESAPADGDLPELDVSQIVRPERFITPELSGLAVPTMTTIDDKPVGRWLLYLRWSDGRRQRLPIPGYIDMPNGARLWIHPTPAEPTPGTPAGWSRHGRTEWLRGVSVPDPADLFRQVCARIAYYIDLPRDHQAGITATLSLWTWITYCYQAWNAVPYLYVGGPLGSGKSRVFDILSRLVFRPLASSNMTAAALFRTLHAQGGTLLLDEAERLRQAQHPDVQELLSMFLAGYRRGGQATRLEPMGDSFRTVCFDVYGPKALACVAGLPPALASRTIAMTMFRAAPGSHKPRKRIDEDADGWQRLRDDLHVTAIEHGPTWLALSQRPDVCPEMPGRAFELWQPLLALASWLDDQGAQGLLALMKAHALEHIDANKDDQVAEGDEVLLRILANAVRSGDHPTPQEILRQAQEEDGGLFTTWHPAAVTRRLKVYGIPTPKKSGSRREFRVTLDRLREIHVAYDIDLDF